MLLAIKHNDETDWKASPRTFMELLQVLHKFRVEFGATDSDFADILKVVNGGDNDH
jgi:L-arabinose isomerase